MIMHFTDYQEKSRRTWNTDQSDKDQLLNAVLGIAGESGECVDVIKKVVFHHHPLDEQMRSKIKNEVGDILYYISALCSVLDIDLQACANENVDKLLMRYPDGFSAKDSIKRVDVVE